VASPETSAWQSRGSKGANTAKGLAVLLLLLQQLSLLVLLLLLRPLLP
jgi:hypothetical protein